MRRSCATLAAAAGLGILGWVGVAATGVLAAPAPALSAPTGCVLNCLPPLPPVPPVPTASLPAAPSLCVGGILPINGHCPAPPPPPPPSPPGGGGAGNGSSVLPTCASLTLPVNGICPQAAGSGTTPTPDPNAPRSGGPSNSGNPPGSPGAPGAAAAAGGAPAPGGSGGSSNSGAQLGVVAVAPPPLGGSDQAVARLVVTPVQRATSLGPVQGLGGGNPLILWPLLGGLNLLAAGALAWTWRRRWSRAAASGAG